MMTDKQTVMDALQIVDDPELEISIVELGLVYDVRFEGCLLYTSPSPRDATLSRMPSSA